MDFALTTEQDMLKRSAREFLAAACKFEMVREMASDERGCPPELWKKITDLGWTMLPFPEQYGGAGAGIVDLAVLLEEMGRVALPGPFLTTVLGGLSILETGTEAQKEELLPDIAMGEKIATLAILEAGLSYEPEAIKTTATRTASGYVLNGTKLFVPDVHLADYIICAAREGEGISLLVINTRGGNAQGVTATRLETMAGDKQFEVVFENAAIPFDALLGTPGAAWTGLRRVLDIGLVGKCAEMIGGAQRSLDLSVEQGHNRVQFGRPIGSFQAIQHFCANMVTDIDLGRFLTYQAAWLLAEHKPARKEVSIAKAFVGDAYMRVVQLAHQILGGNGLMDEHEMPLFTKRALGSHQFFGSSDHHRELVVRELGL